MKLSTIALFLCACCLGCGSEQASQAPVRPAAFLDDSMDMDTGNTFIREVTAGSTGEITFRVTSQGGFTVYVVTAAGHKSVKENPKQKFPEEELLLMTVSKSPTHEGAVTIPAGSSYFYIKNDAADKVNLRLECFPPG